jgi:hypothetical protein
MAIELEAQSSGTVLMVRPAVFYGNHETAADNRFQGSLTGLDAPAVLAAARAEWDGLATALEEAGVRVLRFESIAADDTPDALYPNNWFSTHADGRIVLYPMLAPNRRRERRRDILDALANRSGLRVSEVCDLTALEHDARYVEGTGSLLIDRPRRQVYVCRSARSDPQAVAAVAALFGWSVRMFSALDAGQQPIYHTNVMLALGTGYAVACLAAVADPAERSALRHALEDSGREVVEISLAQVGEFCGNVLEVRGRDGPHLAMSSRALAAFSAEQLQRIARYATPLAVPVPVIETIGGGGVRCMIAEIFLPPA